MTRATRKKPTKSDAATIEEPLPALDLDPGTSCTRTVDELEPMPNNRAHGDLEDLVESVRRHGILQPIIVRPHPARDTGYQIVAGVRRWEAARAAGLESVPVVVRNLDDRQAVEVRAVENLRRRDLSPVEEARLFAELVALEEHGGVKVAARRAGRSPSYVYARLALLRLPEDLLELLERGELELSRALLVSSIAGPDQQRKAWEFVRKFAEVPLPQLERMLRRDFMLDLDAAPFSLADAELVLEAGPCSTCPKRTSTQPELFAEADRSDSCLDPACYRSKVERTYENKAAAFRADGLEVLSKKRCREVFADGGRALLTHAGSREFVRAEDKLPEVGDGKRSVAALLRTDLPPRVLGRDAYGAPVELVSRKAVMAAARKAGLVAAPPKASTKSPTLSKGAVKAKEEADRRERVGKAIASAVLEAFEAGSPGPERELALLAALEHVSSAYHGRNARELLGLPPTKARADWRHSVVEVKQAVAALSPAHRLRFAVASFLDQALDFELEDLGMLCAALRLPSPETFLENEARDNLEKASPPAKPKAGKKASKKA